MANYSMTDPDTLRGSQYADSGNLSARAALHARFSTNRTGWHQWVFDQLDIARKARILEAGCGPGWLWKHNAERVPSGWRITLTDFSDGMLDDAQRNLADTALDVAFEVCDIQRLPFDDATFDAVIANHMLYHVPDIPAALREVHRVLKPGGLFYAATNGVKHMREIHELGQRIAPELYASFQEGYRHSLFELENGAETLSAVFDRVERLLYEDALVVTEVEPLVAYILSMVPGRHVTDEQIDALRGIIRDEITATGAVLIAKDTGMFIARKTRQVVK